MITLSDSIEVEATPEEVFEWLVERFKDKESYQAWHPDHVDIRWIKGGPLKEGSIVCADEYLHGVLHRLKFRIVKIVPNRRIEYRSLFPLSLLAPGNTFVIEPKAMVDASSLPGVALDCLAGSSKLLPRDTKAR